MIVTLVMAPKSVRFRRHDHLVSVLFGDLLSHSYNITFSMFLYLVINIIFRFLTVVKEVVQRKLLKARKTLSPTDSRTFLSVSYTVNISNLSLSHHEHVSLQMMTTVLCFNLYLRKCVRVTTSMPAMWMWVMCYHIVCAPP